MSLLSDRIHHHYCMSWVSGVPRLCLSTCCAFRTSHARKRIRLSYFSSSSATRSSSSTHVDDSAEKIILAAQKQLSLLDAVDAAKNRKQKQELQEVYDAHRKALELVVSLNAIRNSKTEDKDMRELAELELEEAIEAVSSSQTALLDVLVPELTSSSYSALLEIKAGVGGTESGIFAGELARLYSRLSARKGWKSQIVESTALAGYANSTVGDPVKEAILEVNGHGAYGFLKNEAGVHRVQRVPATEASGRLHTSTVGVIVLPLDSNSAQGNSDDQDNLFEQKDVKVEVMRSRGAGGQHVNRTESAVRLTHLPTGITVSMQDSRSQHENRAKAYKVLRARLMDLRIQSEIASRRSARLSQVRATDRSEKIRTYNFPQDRVTDHRIPLTLSGVEDALEGGETIDIVVRQLDRKEKEEALDAIIAS